MRPDKKAVIVSIKVNPEIRRITILLFYFVMPTRLCPFHCHVTDLFYQIFFPSATLISTKLLPSINFPSKQVLYLRAFAQLLIILEY